jgi:hypothetical protein
VVLLVYCSETEEAEYAGATRHMTRYYGDARRHYRLEEIAGGRGYEHYQNQKVDAGFLDYDIWGTPEMGAARVHDLASHDRRQPLAPQRALRPNAGRRSRSEHSPVRRGEPSGVS